MKCSGNHLLTPVYLKLEADMPWPEDELAFHLLTADGLFLCRNHPLFRSCVPATGFPSELASQHPFLRLKYPRIPRLMLERVVGFFEVIGRRHQSEAAVLLVWNRDTKAIEIIVPDQVGIVSSGSHGTGYPIELEYEVPVLPPHLLLVGDIHSHVDYVAYASGTDQRDERHRPGLHLVVGRLYQEPPEFHCEVIADGMRFKVRDLGAIVEGYTERREHQVPQEWIDKVTIQPLNSSVPRLSASTAGDGFGDSHEYYDVRTVDVLPIACPTSEGGHFQVPPAHPQTKHPRQK